jgi:hypothetical protein
MTTSPLIPPVVALVAWTLVMLVWMAARRLPVLRGRPIPDGARGTDLPPGPHNWAGHNYEHLLEQPTIFYAIVFALILMGFDAAINVYLAWGYVILRIVHSLIQATINVVKWRFLVFALSTFCLLSLTVHAGLKILHDCGILTF